MTTRMTPARTWTTTSACPITSAPAMLPESDPPRRKANTPQRPTAAQKIMTESDKRSWRRSSVEYRGVLLERARTRGPAEPQAVPPDRKV
jgi:hypothetical protein